ncbi:MAG: glucose-6-phosphate isomerase [Kofleriaceae bacterium]
MPTPITLDLNGLTAAVLGDHGLTEADLDGRAAAAAAAVDAIAARRAAGEIGFMDLVDDRGPARACLDYARGLPADVDTMVVLGIGGSSLGPKALYGALARPLDALRPRSPGMPRRLLFPDNADPSTLAAILEVCDPARTVWNVVTKSGGTAETASQLLVVADHLERTLGPDRARQHLVATTDPTAGALRATATAQGWPTFAIPASVGGRFSVLTAVGLLPAAAAGLDVVGLLDGAQAMRDRCVGRDLRTNPALLLATMLHLHHVERGRPMVVLMAYADALYDLADWFRQLWAESLGKERATDGRLVNVGPTPIAARGATDQHSQLQLYVEGPRDKVVLMMAPLAREVELTIPATALAASRPEYAYLAGRGMGELLDAELRGTIGSLVGRQRPTGVVALPRIDAHAVGQVIMLLELATAYAGPLYGVDPFDQPGVEEAKRLAYAALGRDGYAELAGRVGPLLGEGRYAL